MTRALRSWRQRGAGGQLRSSHQGVYDHYRWLALLGERQAKKDTKSLTGYLAETDAWRGRKLKSAARELEF